MIICGIEEPLDEKNELFALDAGSQQVILCGISNPLANRYIFVWKGDVHQGSSALALLMRTMIQRLSITASWISAWAVPNGNDLRDQVLRTRLTEMRHDRKLENWDILTKESLSVASKQVSLTFDLSKETGLVPANFSGVGWKRILIILGEPPNLNEFFVEPAISTMLKFANSGTLAPNSQFVSWLVERNLSLIYSPSELIGCTSLVCIGSHTIPIEQVSDPMQIRLHKDAEVMSVWQTRC